MAENKLCKLKNNKFWQSIDGKIIKRYYTYGPYKDMIFYTLIPLLIIVAVVFLLCVTNNIQLNGTFIAALLVAIVSIVIATFHLSSTKRIAQAELIFEYNKAFLENKKFSKILTTVENARFFEGDARKIDKINWRDLANYLTYFEPLNICLKKGIIPHYLIDDLFTYRFWLLFRFWRIEQPCLINNKKPN